jgi:diacylglycerol diphosphate phosphatase/phosphatidate phosphatase
MCIRGNVSDCARRNNAKISRPLHATFTYRQTKMMLPLLVRSQIFKRNFADWVLAVLLFVYFFAVAEHAKPFHREFSLSDPTIQHPFANDERVSGMQCLLIASMVPLFTIVGVAFYRRDRLKPAEDHIHYIQLSVLGLLLSLTINGVFTDILKNWIARPRPDFLARCGPAKGTDPVKMVTIAVCTAPLGQRVLTDGMRSTPSGHASISFSGLLYLTLWLCGHFRVTRPTSPVYKLLLAVLPVLGATYIALSRTQDYRHHFSDIVLGGLLGNLIALGIYHKYFPSIFSAQPDQPLLPKDDDVSLPIFNRAPQGGSS